MIIDRIGRSAAAAALFWAAAAPAETGAGATARIGHEIAGLVASWNRGDLEASLQSYCPSSEISWVNASGLTHGFDVFARSMREEFGQSPGTMGTMAMEVLESRELGDRGLVVVRWSIVRGGRRLMGGISSQLWAQCDGRMRIVFEHAS
jgi:hypothetical protein